MVFIHVIRGRPSGLLQFSAGEAVKICLASVSSGIRAMCPYRDRRLDWTMAERETVGGECENFRATPRGQNMVLQESRFEWA